MLDTVNVNVGRMAVGRRQDRGGFLLGEPWDPQVVGAGGLDGQDLLDHLRVVEGEEHGVAKQRVDRGQTVVAGAGTVAAFGLHMAQEPGDQLVVELIEPHSLRRCAGDLLGVVQQQAPGVSVAGNRVRARVLLLDQLDAEESLQHRRQIAHGPSLAGPLTAPPLVEGAAARSIWSLAACSSSGASAFNRRPRALTSRLGPARLSSSRSRSRW